MEDRSRYVFFPPPNKKYSAICFPIHPTILSIESISCSCTNTRGPMYNTPQAVVKPRANGSVV